MTIYLIDDDSLGNYLTEALLRLENFASQIRTYESAEDALEELLQAPVPPRVIFLDLNMPVMSGWDFLEALAPYRPRLLGQCHIYILTSSLALSDMEKARTYDLVSGLIHKPIDREEIRAIQAELTTEDHS
ncbi:response regulator [Hymenobacter jeollabukensis]|uniref:Response regulator n=1 Tax=Hymenobacter jeollabukensis TaxID=2025313 RepID=A0A5R8WWM4_9BACT|nr:response regulator [Hymenobacter jeollabukensis]TLM96930.1 response regulator [Hymenobacter jeollabukensis]